MLVLSQTLHLYLSICICIHLHLSTDTHIYLWWFSSYGNKRKVNFKKVHYYNTIEIFNDKIVLFIDFFYREISSLHSVIQLSGFFLILLMFSQSWQWKQLLLPVNSTLYLSCSEWILMDISVTSITRDISCFEINVLFPLFFKVKRKGKKEKKNTSFDLDDCLAHISSLDLHYLDT